MQILDFRKVDFNKLREIINGIWEETNEKRSLRLIRVPLKRYNKSIIAGI